MSRPLKHQWPEALRAAIEIVEAAGLSDHPWRFTGGSALATLYEHRFSRDADLFFDPAIDIVSAESSVKDQFGYSTKATAGYSLKVFLPQGSHVDLVNVRPLTTLPSFPFEFEGRTIEREHPVEILAKKIRFRGEEATPRDIFDFATVIALADHQWEAAAIASGYGGMAKLSEAMADGPDDFIRVAPTEIASAHHFDPRTVWDVVADGVERIMPAVLWADAIRQFANRPANWRREWAERAVLRATQRDSYASRISEALRYLETLGEFSLGDGHGAASDAILEFAPELHADFRDAVMELGSESGSTPESGPPG